MKPAVQASQNARQMKKKQAGLTLVELSIALAIGAVITIVGVIFANDALKESRISGEAARLNSVIMKARAAYANSSYQRVGQVNAASTLQAAQLNVFPVDMIQNGNVNAPDAVINRWGGPVTFGADPAANLLYVTYAGIPRGDCLEFVNRVESLFNTINGAAAPAVGDVKPQGQPVVLATLAAQCADPVNDFSFGFSK